MSASPASQVDPRQISMIKSIFTAEEESKHITGHSKTSPEPTHTGVFEFPAVFPERGSQSQSDYNSCCLTPGTPISISSSSADEDLTVSPPDSPRTNDRGVKRGKPASISISSSSADEDLTVPQPESPRTNDRAVKRCKAASVKATGKDKMQRIMSDNAKAVHTSNLPQPYILNTEELILQMQSEYTGKGYNLRTFLEFMSAEVSVCPLDTTKALSNWGFLPKNVFAQRLKRYADHNDRPANKAWGKVASTLFGIFAAIVWPNRSKHMKPKRRHYYGMKLLHFASNESDTSLASPPSTPSTTSWGSQSTTTTPSLTQPIRTVSFAERRRKTLKKMGFQPYYDVLQNPQTYVVRVFLPLVSPKEIQKVQIDSNLAQKSLSISGYRETLSART